MKSVREFQHGWKWFWATEKRNCDIVILLLLCSNQLLSQSKSHLVWCVTIARRNEDQCQWYYRRMRISHTATILAAGFEVCLHRTNKRTSCSRLPSPPAILPVALWQYHAPATYITSTPRCTHRRLWSLLICSGYQKNMGKWWQSITVLTLSFVAQRRLC